MDSSGEVEVRREIARQEDGRFGSDPGTPPELQLPGLVPQEILELIVDTEEALQTLNEAIVHEIDATMPAEADFVNYELDDTNHLVIREVLGDYGLEIPQTGYEHIGESLRLLGEPYVDFDGDLVMNSLDVFGWEREEEYDPLRDNQARLERAIAYERWKRTATKRQGVAIEAIRNHGGKDIEAFDFAWDQATRTLSLAAIIRKDGRSEVPCIEDWGSYNTIAAYINEPGLSEMIRSDLTGQYRLRGLGTH
ncbi:hypothetical protein [Microbacterium sp. 77mftsu3.1]|uniref:hypothetical protein n=1 Tax=Microbacterium sp. 77mftsu3.1 TaxID=1761802 RepID=UPI00088C0834|nr:hypothetical protein [Microbacterium sp. 77mftsu3.1]SDH33811.1 hypothetical protein SAMN04488590_3066 [Microbacterium sp. 77mftsu3.1]